MKLIVSTESRPRNAERNSIQQNALLRSHGFERHKTRDDPLRINCHGATIVVRHDFGRFAFKKRDVADPRELLVKLQDSSPEKLVELGFERYELPPGTSIAHHFSIIAVVWNNQGQAFKARHVSDYRGLMKVLELAGVTLEPVKTARVSEEALA